MKPPKSPKKSFSSFRAVKRQAVRVSQEELVKTRFLDGDQDEFPLVVEPNLENVDPMTWAASSRDFLETRLLRHGAILFRGFAIESPERFREFCQAISPELLDYKERAAPRHEVKTQVFTSTEFPEDQIIPLHHEMSYSHNWPTKIWFYCDQAPAEGGRTPIADDRKLIEMIDPEVRERFTEKGVMYVRNYGEGVDLTWQEAFQTEDRAVVEAYCRAHHTDFEWRDGNRLRTRARRQVYATHPKTGDTVWFNHAHMFHSSNLPQEVRDALLSEFAEDELPRNAFYGDGSAIESSILEDIRALHEEQATRFTWQEGDVLMVDNFLTIHGREPFRGPRKILVSMAELYVNPEFGSAA